MVSLCNSVGATRIWGEVREAISTGTVAEQDATLLCQIRVFLDSQFKMLAHLPEPSTECLIRSFLTDAIPLAPDREVLDSSDTFKWLSLISICLLTLGFVTGFREIVKERSIFDLERKHGWRIPAYIIAKVAALAVVLLVQVAIFRTTVELGFRLREAFGGDSLVLLYRRSIVLSASMDWIAALA
ncbi:MAG: hypothetical protein RLY14_2941, partial [Planctomycetota bacterium]